MFWIMKVMVISFAIGAIETISKGLVNEQEYLEIKDKYRLFRQQHYQERPEY